MALSPVEVGEPIQLGQIIDRATRRRVAAVGTLDFGTRPGVDQMGQLQRVQPRAGRNVDTDRVRGGVQNPEVVAEPVVGDNRERRILISGTQPGEEIP